MTIEAQTCFLGESFGKHQLRPGATLTSVEMERWIPRDPMWRSEKLFVLCSVVDNETIEVRSTFYNWWLGFSRRAPGNMAVSTILKGDQINGKIVRGRFTQTRLSWKP